MHLFLADIQNQIATLSPEESHHLSRVLRMAVGDEVLVTDGKGNLYQGKISTVHQKKSEIGNLVAQEYLQKRDYQLEIALAPTKQMDRTEWFLEKAIEVGLDAFHPIISYHSERRKINIDRLKKRGIAAMKQSLKAETTHISDLQTFQDFVLKSKDFSGQKLIAHCYDAIARKPLAEMINSNENYLILIGPEGDFSQEEVSFAEENGFTSVSLGDQRLRTETAALSCVMALHWIQK